MNFLTKHRHYQLLKCSVACVGKARTRQNKREEHGLLFIVDQYI
jgi:hypothetical protein